MSLWIALGLISIVSLGIAEACTDGCEDAFMVIAGICAIISLCTGIAFFVNVVHAVPYFWPAIACGYMALMSAVVAIGFYEYKIFVVFWLFAFIGVLALVAGNDAYARDNIVTLPEPVVVISEPVKITGVKESFETNSYVYYHVVGEKKEMSEKLPMKTTKLCYDLGVEEAPYMIEVTIQTIKEDRSKEVRTTKVAKSETTYELHIPEEWIK